MARKFLNTVFVIEDDLVFGKVIQRALEKDDNVDVKVFQSGRDFFENLHLNPDIVSIDYNLPDMNGLDILGKVKEFNQEIKTIILSGQEKVDVVVSAYKNGANSYIVKNENAIVELANTVRNLGSSVNLRKEVEVLQSDIIERHKKYSNVVGESGAVLKVLKMIQKVENSNILVLITGESGTGKEVIAQTIHYNSNRKKRPFVAVNVAAIPADLIESELFGHEKGAFTGATGRRIGKFEEANGGTIFLDEIGEMELGLQTKLLRVLQESEVTRLGSNKSIKLDVRVLAATNKNLHKRVADGLFREDLYYRLQGFLIPLPPLKERGNDIVILAKHFLQAFCKQNKSMHKVFNRSALEALLAHNWPGNVRELKACVERAALISDGEEIDESDLIFSASIY